MPVSAVKLELLGLTAILPAGSVFDPTCGKAVRYTPIEELMIVPVVPAAKHEIE
jgi:hypothetical protein